LGSRSRRKQVLVFGVTSPVKQKREIAGQVRYKGTGLGWAVFGLTRFDVQLCYVAFGQTRSRRLAHLTLVLDGGIEAVVQTLALEVDLIHGRHGGQEGIGRQVVAVRDDQNYIYVSLG